MSSEEWTFETVAVPTTNPMGHLALTGGLGKDSSKYRPNLSNSDFHSPAVMTTGLSQAASQLAEASETSGVGWNGVRNNSLKESCDTWRSKSMTAGSIKFTKNWSMRSNLMGSDDDVDLGIVLRGDLDVKLCDFVLAMPVILALKRSLGC